MQIKRGGKRGREDRERERACVCVCVGFSLLLNISVRDIGRFGFVVVYFSAMLRDVSTTTRTGSFIK